MCAFVIKSAVPRLIVPVRKWCVLRDCASYVKSDKLRMKNVWSPYLRYLSCLPVSVQFKFSIMYSAVSNIYDNICLRVIYVLEASLVDAHAYAATSTHLPKSF